MQTIEIYTVFIKGLNETVGVRQILALANIIQYAARIMYLFALFGLTLLFEVKHLTTEILWILLAGFALGGIGSIAICISAAAKRAMDLFFLPIVKFSFPDLKPIFQKSQSRQTIFETRNFTTKVFFSANLSSTLIGAAAILPFCIAMITPEYRMLATYSGQILNFTATTVLFLFVEPSLFKHLDNASNEEPGICQTAKEIICAKMVSQVFLVLGIILAIYLFE